MTARWLAELLAERRRPGGIRVTECTGCYQQVVKVNLWGEVLCDLRALTPLETLAALGFGRAVFRLETNRWDPFADDYTYFSFTLCQRHGCWHLIVAEHRCGTTVPTEDQLRRLIP